MTARAHGVEVKLPPFHGQRTGSMSRAGEVWDNSVMESFFSSLKTERTACNVDRSAEQARADVSDRIERFHDPTLRHSTPGDVSQIERPQADDIRRPPSGKHARWPSPGEEQSAGTVLRPGSAPQGE